MSNLNPFLIIKESYNVSLYDYFDNEIYPKSIKLIFQVINQMFSKYLIECKIRNNLRLIKANGNNDENVCKIDLMDSDSKTYKATIEVRMGFDYIDRDGYENDDGIWYMAYVVFNLNGQFKIQEVFCED